MLLPNEETNARFERVAEWLLESDYLIIATGAGFSKDSGLPVYADVCDDPIYCEKHKVSYQDLSKPSCLIEHPRLFYGFWTECLVKYRQTDPHEGYKILEKWVSRGPGALPKIAENCHYVYTSNVDGHFRRFPEMAKNLMEIHGCAEDWMCSRFMGLRRERTGPQDQGRHSWQSAIGSLLKRTTSEGNQWRMWDEMYRNRMGPTLECMASFETAPANYFAKTNDDHEFTGNVERPLPSLPPSSPSEGNLDAFTPESPVALPRNPSSSFSTSSAFQGIEWPTGNNVGELPKCKACGELARPAVVMFDDSDASLIDRVFQHGEVYQKWECDMEKDIVAQGKKLCILEIGCGTHVPSVRMECEQICKDLTDSLANDGKNTSDHLRLIRINPEVQGKTSEIFNVDHIPEKALDVLKLIDNAVQAKLAKRSGMTIFNQNLQPAPA